MAVPSPDTVALWWHYEELAMHFNGLIMQFRLQVLGGAGAIGAVSGYLSNSGTITDGKQRERLRTQIALSLWILILCAALLDVFYYRLLLEGAVIAIVDLEKQHPEIQMSTDIQRVVGSGVNVIYWVYGLLLTTLGYFVITSWRTYRKSKHFR